MGTCLIITHRLQRTMLSSRTRPCESEGFHMKYSRSHKRFQNCFRFTKLLNGNGKTAFARFETIQPGSAFCVFNHQLFGKKGLHICQCSSPLCCLQSLACLFPFFAHAHTCMPGKNGNGENGTVNAVLVIKMERIWKCFLTSTVVYTSIN